MRQFYLTTFTVQVLSTEPLVPESLDDVAYAVTDGDCVGGALGRKELIITPKEAAATLSSFGSDPEFFQLDAEGNDLNEPGPEYDFDPAPKYDGF